MVNFYLVGGYVRDKILGVKSKDMDYAVEASSFEEMKQAILNKGGSIFLETPEYLTIRARMPGISGADFVLCRKESQYKDGRHPDKVDVGTLYDDLARRDFTMNAIAMDEGGNYIDYFDGIKDIRGRVIRCVGEAHDRFTDDSLRLLRAIRFALTKNFSLHNDIDRCLKDPKVIAGLVSVSGERVREELMRAFKADTLGTLLMLEKYPLLRNQVCEVSKLWFKPTFEE